jgi:hypothetical protein
MLTIKSLTSRGAAAYDPLVPRTRVITRIIPGSLPAICLLSFVTLALPCPAADRLPAAARADRVFVLKSARTLTLMDHGRVLKEYKVALGGRPIGAKTRQGDHKTPEGSYILDQRIRRSQFYRSIHISYPGPEDRARAHTLKVSPGGDIMIHGLPNGFGFLGKSHLADDWTDGCIAVTNEEMDEIWRAVADRHADRNQTSGAPPGAVRHLYLVLLVA